MPWEFSIGNPIDLTRFVNPEVKDQLRIDHTELFREGGSKAGLIKAIYNALLKRELRYSLEVYNSSDVVQLVRTPTEIFRQCEGTCLELTLLFAGFCVAYELLPIIVLLDGHALLAVSMNHSLRQWNAPSRKEYEPNILLTNLDSFVELIRTGAYLPIDCTGFARTNKIPDIFPEGRGRQSDGSMTFERAVAAGGEQFNKTASRFLKHALDVAVAHHFWKIRPYSRAEIVESVEAAQSNIRGKLLAYLCDRSQQDFELKGAVLAHRATKPLRPFLCIIHGHERECHPAFLNKISEQTLPEILLHCYPADQSPSQCADYLINPSLQEYTSENVHVAINRDLAAQTLRNGKVYDQIVAHKSARCVVLNFVVFSEACKRGYLQSFDAFFKYWNEIDDLPRDLLLMVILNFRFRQPTWHPGKLFARLRQKNRKLQLLVDELGSRKFSRLNCLKLTELKAVAQLDAEKLVNNERINHFFDFRVGDVEGLYARRKLCVDVGYMHMETLLTNLWSLQDKRKGT